MIVHLKNGYCIDGMGLSGKQDLYLRDGVIHHTPPEHQPDSTIDLNGHIVMAGGIDMHTHIGGGKVNLARLLLPELVARNASVMGSEGRDRWSEQRPLTSPVPPASEIGLRYLEMGYTTCFEPAVLPANARYAHREMSDIPWLDTGGYLMLGNDRLLLEWIAQRAPQAQIDAYVATMLRLHQCCGVKVVNAGGIEAFKFNQRHLNVDQKAAHYPITPRDILRTLARAVDGIGLPHPLHVHCSNLGTAGNIESTMQTLEAVEGHRVHLTHAQYHCYGKIGPHGYSSEASLLAEYVNWHPHVTIDVGQVLFGQTVTISGDTMHQHLNRKLARPGKVIFQDAECQAGCGVVPFRYRHDQYVHGLQWTIGLELCLRILDPARVFLTTDHPNGGPFTAYPHLIKLLSNYDYRMSIFDQLHPDVRATSTLPTLKREYTLEEIAIMTRVGPARILGLADRGALADGMQADIAVYQKQSDLAAMFGSPTYVFRRGEQVLAPGRQVIGQSKTILKQTIVAQLPVDAHYGDLIDRAYVSCYGYSPSFIAISPDELRGDYHDIVEVTAKSH
jgi:formylmethanofuran dehydrogenase subunit A